MIASSPGLVGDDVADAFRSCLDDGPPIARRQVIAAIERAAGSSLATAYRHLDEAPIGTASIAVVHRALTTGGDDVAIKIRRPGIVGLVSSDVRLLRGAAGLGVRFGKSADAAQFLDLVDDFATNVAGELDFSREAGALSRFDRRLSAHGFDRLAVPRVHAGLSDDAVLVMDYFDGVVIDDLDGIAAIGVDAGPLVDEAIHAWLATSVIDGEFHGDCHAGNVLVLRDGRLGLIDWGIVGEVDADGRRCLARILQASHGDDAAWTEVAEFFVDLFGDAVLSEAATTAAELPQVLASMLGPLLTAPFGNGALGRFLDAARARSEAAIAAGGTASASALRDSESDANAAFRSGFFLWLKQLVYFERYARLHQRSKSIAQHAEPVLARLG